jgi:DNA modification methylase
MVRLERGLGYGPDLHESILSKYLPGVRLRPLSQKTIPRLAKDPKALRAIARAVREIPTTHRLCLGDARSLAELRSESVHLIVTSPPYFDLKEYPDRGGQLGGLHDYEQFLKELHCVWEECHRLLVKGGRLIVIVGDVCRSRRRYGHHYVIPLHASIIEDCRHIGFHNLATVVWHKISNAKFEVENGTAFLGKPYEPNAVIKNDVEFILMQRKPGGYRRPSEATRVLSVIGEEEHRRWFNQVVTFRGASTRSHPAPYPIDLLESLVRMFSFAGDVVLDPFSGTGTTSVAAARQGRNSIGVEIEVSYHHHAIQRLQDTVRHEGLPAAVTASGSISSAVLDARE